MFSRIIVTGLTVYDEELTIVQPPKILIPKGFQAKEIHTSKTKAPLLLTKGNTP